MPVRYPLKKNTSPGFVYSGGYTSVNPSDQPTKDPSQGPIINPPSTPGEIPTKDPSHVISEFLSAKPINARIEFSSGYPTGDIITIPTDMPS